MLNPQEIFQFKIEPTEAPTPTTDAGEPTYVAHWELNESCPYLNGHFPNQPVLPAVATVDGSIELVRQALHLPDLQPRSVFNAKFMAPITPGLKIKITLMQVGTSAADGRWQADWTTTGSSNETVLLARVGLHV